MLLRTALFTRLLRNRLTWLLLPLMALALLLLTQSRQPTDEPARQAASTERSARVAETPSRGVRGSRAATGRTAAARATPAAQPPQQARQEKVAVRSLNDGFSAYLETRAQHLQGWVEVGSGLRLRYTPTAEKKGGQAEYELRLLAHALGRAGNEAVPLSRRGVVTVEGEQVRWVRAEVTEEYSVSTDGLRQDFLLAERPQGEGELRLELTLQGARAEPAAYGAKLQLEGDAALAYSQLHVEDALGKTLPARMEVTSGGEIVLAVNDTDAHYPVRIDPTVSELSATFKLYFNNNSAYTMSRAGLDGSSLQLIFPNDGVSSPDALAVDGTSNTLYYVNNGNVPKGIYKSSLAALPLSPTHIIANDWIKDIALDLTAGKIYYSEAATVSGVDHYNIYRANLDGSNIELVVPDDGLFSPAELAIDTASNTLFFYDAVAKAVFKAPLSAPAAKTPVISIPAPGPSFRLVDMAVANGKIYFSTFDPYVIYRANLDGSGAEVVLPDDGVTTPEGIAIDPYNGNLYFSENFDTNGIYKVALATLPQASPITKQLIVSQTGIRKLALPVYYDAPPTNITLSTTSVAENIAAGVTVGNLSTSDLNVGDTFTYSLVSGTGSTDNASFTLVGNALRTATVFNFESKSSYTIRVRSTDSSGLFTEKQFTITVTDVNDAPTTSGISNLSTQELSPTLFLNLPDYFADEDNPLTYSVSGGGAVVTASVAGATLSITPVAGGSALLTVRATDSGGLWVEASFTVEVVALRTVSASAGTGGTITPASQTVPSGSTATLTVAPDIGYSIGTVSGCSGTLSGNTYTTGAITSDCAVSTIFMLNNYTVITMPGSGGTITPFLQIVNHGSTTSFTVTASTGYHILSVSGCGGTLAGNTYTTGAITSDCYVNPIFELNSYAVTATAGTGGTITPAAQSVNHGSTTTFTVTPSTGYSIGTVSGCGGTLAGNTFTTGAITSACAVSASFTLNSYAVTATAGSGGTITPAAQSVNHGSTTTFTVTPTTGYSIGTVSGCGGTLAGNTFTTGTLTGACAVSASFTLNSYAVTATAGSGGTITPAAQSVTHGSTTTLTVTPNSGYTTTSVSGCGGTLSGSTYTTGAITAACGVTAQFATIFNITDGAGQTLADQSLAGGKTLTFQLTNGSGNYQVVAAANANGVSGTLLDNGSGSYSFVTPATGAFAGDYLLTISDSDSGWSEQLTVSVPLKVALSRTTLLSLGERNQASVTVTGAAPGTAITLGITSTALSGLPLANDTGMVAADDSAHNNPASGSVTAQATAQSVAFEVTASAAGYPTGRSAAQVLPATTYSGYLFDFNGALTATEVGLWQTPLGGSLQQASDELGQPYTVLTDSGGNFVLYAPPLAAGETQTLQMSAANHQLTQTDAAICLQASGGCAIELQFAQATEQPAFSHAAGHYPGGVTLTLTSPTAGAAIRYTLDGTTPTPSHGIALQNGQSVTLNQSATLKAIAYMAGQAPSAVTEAAYVIDPVKASGGGGTLPLELSVLLLLLLAINRLRREVR